MTMVFNGIPSREGEREGLRFRGLGGQGHRGGITEDAPSHTQRRSDSPLRASYEPAEAVTGPLNRLHLDPDPDTVSTE